MAGADPNAPVYSATPHTFAAIVKKCLHPVAPARTAFLIACGTDYGWILGDIRQLRRHPDDRQLVRTMLTHGANVNACTDYNQSALLGAVTNYHLHAAEELLKHGVDIDAPDNAGQTALMWAVMDHEPDMVRLLLSSGANVNIKDHGGNNAIYYATWAGAELDIFRQLLMYRADPTAQNNMGESASISIEPPEIDALLRAYRK